VTFEQYVETVGDRLSRGGFTPEEPAAGAALQARRRTLKLTRFGLVETVVALSALRETASVDDLLAFDTVVFGSALERKSRVPRGLGSSMVVYPVLVAGDVPAEVHDFLADHTPDHWSVIELPVAVEISSGSLTYSEKTPVWGSAYYKKTRKEALELLAVKAS